MEYVLVTAFTLATGAAALAYITTLVKEKLHRINESTSDDSESSMTDFLSDS